MKYNKTIKKKFPIISILNSIKVIMVLYTAYKFYEYTQYSLFTKLQYAVTEKLFYMLLVIGVVDGIKIIINMMRGVD